jgi:hypothetical protein
MAAVFFHILKKRKNAWLYGGSGPREREPVGSKARNEEEREIMEGVLQKRGARVGDAWNDRWVVLCKKELFYKYWDRASDSQGAIIDRIPLTDIEVRFHVLFCCLLSPGARALALQLFAVYDCYLHSLPTVHPPAFHCQLPKHLHSAERIIANVIKAT